MRTKMEHGGLRINSLRSPSLRNSWHADACENGVVTSHSDKAAYPLPTESTRPQRETGNASTDEAASPSGLLLSRPFHRDAVFRQRDLRACAHRESSRVR